MHRPLTEPDLLPHGPLRRLGTRVCLFDEIDSTNSFLLGQAASLPDGTVASAEFQTAGRGRHGRPWHAPRGAAVIISVLLIEPADSPLTSTAALVASLAACRAVDSSTDCEPLVRWPNDLVLNKRKVGGVLAESTLLAVTPRRRAIVIGVGLNCLQHRGHFPDEIAGHATSLEIESREAIDRAKVAAHIISHLDETLARFLGRAEWRRGVLEEWKAHCADLGARVELQHDGRRVSGTVLDITEDGDLLVQLDEGGRRRFESATTTRCW